jgi:excinuclease UvrABC nuclease subunit
MTKDEQYQKQIDQAFRRLITKLDKHVMALEAIGENDMGLLHFHKAQRFHTATESLRTVVNELKESTK